MTASPKIPFRRLQRLHAANLKIQDRIAQVQAAARSSRQQKSDAELQKAREADAKASAVNARMQKRKAEFIARRAREGLQPPPTDKFPAIKNDGVGGHAKYVARETWNGLHCDTQRRLLVAQMREHSMADVERARTLLSTEPELICGRVREEILSRANRE